MGTQVHRLHFCSRAYSCRPLRGCSEASGLHRCEQAARLGPAVPQLWPVVEKDGLACPSALAPDETNAKPHFKVVGRGAGAQRVTGDACEVGGGHTYAAEHMDELSDEGARRASSASGAAVRVRDGEEHTLRCAVAPAATRDAVDAVQQRKQCGTS